MGYLSLFKSIRRFVLSAVIAFPLGCQNVDAKFPLTVFKGVTDCLSDTKKYLSPTIGMAALESGVVSNIRLYGNFDAAYRQTTAGPERDYANDQSNDPVWQLTRILFPSTAGQLSGDSGHRYNFGKHVRNPKTVALLINYADDIRSGKTIDEDRLKNDLMASMGFTFKEKMSRGEKVKKAFDSMQNDRKLAKEITIIAQRAVNDYSHKNGESQRRLGEAKNKLLQAITRKIKKMDDGTIQAIFMDKIRELYQFEHKDYPGEKSPPVKPEFFRTVLWQMNLAQKESTGILENTKIQERILQIGKREPKQTFLFDFKKETLTPLLEAIKQAILAESSEKVFYPKYTAEQIILAFLAYKFSTREDIKTFLTHLSPGIVNREALDTFNPLDLLIPDNLPQIAEKGNHTPDDILALSTADIWGMPTPYRVGTPFLSNGNTRKYDRKSDSFVPGTFADCVEISLRHIINCFLYDPHSRQFDFKGLAKYHGENPLSPAQEVIFATFMDFYQRQSIDLANDGSMEMRSQWNRVVGDLNSPDDPLEIKIHYRQGANELDAGFINLMKVFQKVLGIHLDPVPETNQHDKKKWLDTAFQEVFKALNPHKGYSIGTNMDNVNTEGTEISGFITITVYDEQRKMLYSFGFSSNPARHGQLEDYRVSDDLKMEDYSSYLQNSSFKGNDAEKAIWLLSKVQWIKMSKSLPTFYLWFRANLIDNEAKILFLDGKEYAYGHNKSLIPPHELKRALKNVISDLNLDDILTINKVAPALLSLLKRKELKDFVDQGLKYAKFGKKYERTRDYKTITQEALELITRGLFLNNQDLTSLYLTAFHKTDVAKITALLQALTTNTILTSFELLSGKIEDSGAEVLSQVLKTNKTLTSLTLVDNGIGKDGAVALSQALATNRTLTYLHSRHNKIGDAGAEALSQDLTTNTTLTSLGLRSANIGYAGAIALSQALTRNKTLTSLDLRSNSIGNAGAEALSQALATNTILTSLYLDKRNFDPDTMAQLEKLHPGRIVFE